VLLASYINDTDRGLLVAYRDKQQIPDRPSTFGGDLQSLALEGKGLADLQGYS
jgi:hypothetical protein